MPAQPGVETPGYFSDVPSGQWQKPMIVVQSFRHFTRGMAKVIVSDYRNRMYGVKVDLLA